jgi:hypothetical protein
MRPSQRTIRILIAAAVVVGATIAVYLLARPGAPPRPSTAEPGYLAWTDIRPHLTSEQRQALERFASDEERRFYAAGFAAGNSDAPEPAWLDVLVEGLRATPVRSDERASGPLPATVGHGAFALATFTQVWYRLGPLDAYAETIQREVARLSASDDEILRLQCAMVLRQMESRPGAFPLSAQSRQTLDRLLANDWVAHNVTIQDARVLAPLQRR